VPRVAATVAAVAPSTAGRWAVNFSDCGTGAGYAEVSG
jgi:hypothetical protein